MIQDEGLECTHGVEAGGTPKRIPSNVELLHALEALQPVKALQLVPVDHQPLQLATAAEPARFDLICTYVCVCMYVSASCLELFVVMLVMHSTSCA